MTTNRSVQFVTAPRLTCNPKQQIREKKGIIFFMRLLILEIEVAVNVYVAVIKAAEVTGEMLMITNQLSFILAVAPTEGTT